jgi:membrane protein implicated in regulation of membrane protease activity
METFGGALNSFLHWTLEVSGPIAYIVFIGFAGAVGAAVVLLDACSVSLGGDSYLKLTHGWRATPRALLVWMIGATIAAGVGLAVRIFEPTPLAAVVAALTWRSFIRQLQAISHRPHEDEQRSAGG